MNAKSTSIASQSNAARSRTKGLLFALPLLALAFVIAGSVVSAQAETPAKPAEGAKAEREHCFNANNISSWRYVDKNTVDIRSGVRNWFRLTLAGSARELDFDISIALKTRGSSWICTGDRFAGDILPAGGHASRWRYPITAVALAPDHPKFIKAEAARASETPADPPAKG